MNRESGSGKMGPSAHARAAAHYAWSVLVLGVYGGQVCPYIEGLGIGYWLMVLGGFFGAAFIIRPILEGRFVMRSSYEGMVGAQFILDLALFISVSIAITTYNYSRFNFPIESGIKIVVGTLTLGFFAAADLALQRERILTREITESGRHIKPQEKYFPLTAKFMLLSTSSVVLITVVIFLVISKDMDWLVELGQRDFAKARASVLGELLFIAGVVLAGIFNLIASYSRNLRIFFSNENSSLKAVAAGDFSRSVTVSTNDEFGVMAWYTNRMIADLRSIVQELRRTQDATILSLASLAEIRDMETGQHIIRTSLYVRALAEDLSKLEKHSGALTPERIELLQKSAPLHDIGKVGIPDAVLLKPARLTPEEYAVMKRHPVLGGEAIEKAERTLGESSFLSLAREIAYSHHEKWDGSGYPKGLKGEEIPLSGRLMALADVYDALVFRRVYKPALPHEETRAIILDDRGRHFDPEVVDAFLAVEGRFIEIAAMYAEH